MDKQAAEMNQVAETKRTETGMVTKLQGDILFDTGQSVLKPEAMKRADGYRPRSSACQGSCENRGGEVRMNDRGLQLVDDPPDAQGRSPVCPNVDAPGHRH